MATGNTGLSKKLVGQGGKETALSFQSTLEEWKNKHGPKLVQLVGGNQEAANKMFVVCLGVISRNPDLLDCTFDSIAACVLTSFQLGLFPGAFGECAYVPLNNKNTQRKEANFWPMYQGLTKLMRNAGNKMVLARVVYENDYFEYHEGERAPQYCPAVVQGKKRGNRLFTYAAVCTRDGTWQVEVMSPEQVEVIRSRSKRGNSEPWTSKYPDDVDAMWSKTVLKRLSKWVTKSAELIEAIDRDNSVDGDPALEKARVIDLSEVGDSPLVGSEEKAPPAENPKQIEHTERNTVDLGSRELDGAELDNQAAREDAAAMMRRG